MWDDPNNKPWIVYEVWHSTNSLYDPSSAYWNGSNFCAYPLILSDWQYYFSVPTTNVSVLADKPYEFFAVRSRDQTTGLVSGFALTAR